jgi:hypothetical protein
MPLQMVAVDRLQVHGIGPDYLCDVCHDEQGGFKTDTAAEST